MKVTSLYDEVASEAMLEYHRDMKIYTKRGDTGETDLFTSDAGMRRVAKDSLRIEAIGTVDELNSFVGLVRACDGLSDTVCDALIEIQKDLFVLGADLATPGVVAVRGASDVPRVSEGRIEELERLIDALERDLEPMTAFILPGGCEASARLHVCRGVCRRAERVCVGLMREEGIVAGSIQLCIKLLNRLSDLLFVMARWENWKNGVEETKWRG